MAEISDFRDLAHWLEIIGIDSSLWETSSSKTLDNLWDEYVRGEVSFQTDPPLRIVHVVQLIISRDNQILVEVAQEFSNGKRRSRDQPPSEKIKSGEDLYDAALRCLDEELGVKADQVRFIESSYETEVAILQSPSYPGLMTRYTIHTLEAKVAGLPEQEFWRQNKAAVEGDPVKRHLWDWRPRP